MRPWGVATPWFGGIADLPTDVEDKAAGRTATSHIGCCVFCVLFMVRAAFFSYQQYLLCRKSISDRPKLPILAHSWKKMHHQTTQMIRHRESHHGGRILAMPYYESCNNWDRTSLWLPGDFLATSQISLALPRKSRIKLANKYFCIAPPHWYIIIIIYHLKQTGVRCCHYCTVVHSHHDQRQMDNFPSTLRVNVGKTK
jgi:hypothetical protein